MHNVIFRAVVAKVDRRHDFVFEPLVRRVQGTRVRGYDVNDFEWRANYHSIQPLRSKVQSKYQTITWVRSAK